MPPVGLAVEVAMASAFRRLRGPAVPDDLFLHDLADSMSRALDDNGGGALLHVAPAADGYEIGTLTLDGRAPADVLLGSVAPEHWWALGVAARGWARSSTSWARQAAARGGVDVVVLVSRSGQVASRVRRGGTVLTGPPASGITLDSLQRALGLPTAPPEEPTGALFARIWLDQVSQVGAASAERAGPLGWPQIAALHPALQLLAAEGGKERSPGLLVAARALERACDWDQLRWLVVEGKWSGSGVSGTDAAWFDAGSFSRWVLGGRPTIPERLDTLPQLTGPAVARRCAEALYQLGLLTIGSWRPTAAG